MKKLQGLLTATLLFIATCLQAQLPDKIILEKINEPVQKAFSILKPKGWLHEGGVILWDPIAAGGAANAIESKIDFSLKKDPSGTVKIHWLPDIYFADLTGAPAAGMFPEGSTYNGMPVLHKMNASAFLTNHLFPYLHPQIQPSSADSQELPEIVKLCYDTDMMKQLGNRYSAAVSDFIYTEEGVRYKERSFCIIQDMGPYAGGMWKNRSTVVVRAPVESFDQWEPLFHEIGQSVVLNPDWIYAELKGQMQRGSTLIKTMQDVARIGAEIEKSHAETNSKINHDAYLTLTGQEDYFNPFTNKVERGTNQWDHRWVDARGNVIYTNNEVYDPNQDPELSMDGFKECRVNK